MNKNSFLQFNPDDLFKDPQRDAAEYPNRTRTRTYDTKMMVM